MNDNCGRRINYLRISVTDLCNLRCMYCMPEDGVVKQEHRDILSLEEIENIAKAAVALGIDKIRITGGEPLVRNGIVSLIRNIAAIPGIKDLGLTTNGILLKKYAHELKQAGLNRVNISLDSLNPEKYRKITRNGNLNQVLEGIQAAKDAGLSPLKLNVVLIGGFNDDEIEDFINLTLHDDIEVRFIELMPLGQAQYLSYGTSVSNELVLQKVPNLIALPFTGHGCVARLYKLPNAKGKVGLISPLSHHFCNYCNKIRITPDGKLKSCLLSDQEISLKNAGPDQIQRLLYEGIKSKPLRHTVENGAKAEIGRKMHEIGG